MMMRLLLRWRNDVGDACGGVGNGGESDDYSGGDDDDCREPDDDDDDNKSDEGHECGNACNEVPSNTLTSSKPFDGTEEGPFARRNDHNKATSHTPKQDDK